MATAEGDVKPVAGPGIFGPIALYDADNDGLADVILPSGNFIRTSGVSPSDPEGASADGLAWDAVYVWNAWDSKFDVEVGVDGFGSLSVADDMRAQHLTAGVNAGGDGVISLSGAGTVFNNDYDSLPQWVRNTISLANPGGAAVAPEDVTYDMLGDDVNHPLSGNTKQRIPPGNYNLCAGAAGKGEINISAGKQVEVRHQVLIGGRYVSETFTAGVGGKIRIDSQGTVLRCNGKFLADVEEPETVTDAEPCQISAVGVLEMSGGTFWSRMGFVNAGLIDILGSSDTSPEMAAGATGQLENTGLIKVRKGVTFKLGCPLDNANGEVYLEAGAVLQVPSIVNEGLIHRSPCSPAAKLVVGGVTSTPSISLDDLARE